MFIEVRIRRNTIDVQNRFDSMEGVIKKSKNNNLPKLQ